MGAVCEGCFGSDEQKPLHRQQPTLLRTRPLDPTPTAEPSPPPPVKIDFNQKRFIGKSEYGLVIVVTLRNDPTSTQYAMKILMKDKLPPINTSEVLKHKTPHSDFLVNIIQIAEEEKRINILMEYMESRDLNYYRKKAGTFPQETIRDIAAEVLVALQFLHSQNIIYKFLKPENIMLTNQGHIKLTDYVLSKIIDSSRRMADPPQPQSATSMKSSTKLNSLLILPGSVEYMAPCMFKPDKGCIKIDYSEFSTAVDIWTFGILLYELKNGKTPFGGKNPQGIRQQIEKGEYSFMGSCSRELKSLVARILVKDATARPTIGQIRLDPFFKDINWQDIVNRRNPPPLAVYREKFNVKFEEPSKSTERVCIKESIDDKLSTYPQSLNEELRK